MRIQFSRIGILTLLAVFFAPAGLGAQDMPKSDYWHYIPLSYTRPVRQATGSVALDLFGNRNDPGYRDVAPVDGIDDRRHAALHAMGVKFAPYLVLNTTAIPMDWKKFMNGRNSWPLYIDTWNQAVEGGELLREEQIDWLKLPGNPCPNAQAAMPADNDDCRLLSLLREFDPDAPQASFYQQAAIDPQVDPFKVIYWNFPGHDEASWTAEYQDRVSGELPVKYWDYAKTYLHPFIEEVRSNTGGLEGYELVLQYWFFYSWNDGGNNHEGDWEHVNIIVSPKGSVTRPQTAEEITSMLNGGGAAASAGDDYVVIKRVDYYFHEKVWTFNYAAPNAYLPRDQWQAEFDKLPQDRIDQQRIWKMIRQRAYEDAAETVINTHTLGYIGADNKGTDQILAAPGGKNRDSHGTYPFEGLYKNVGPAGASEHITAHVDYLKYFRGPRPGLENGRLGRGDVIRLDRADRVEIVPDWERVQELVYTNAEVRREWSWLTLPIRWGYPAAPSPFAGIVAHAPTGNTAPQTGSQNKGWNRSGAGSGFHEYSPHRYSGYFAMSWQDGFKNNWGFLNATIPTIAIMPPFDLLFKVLGTPIELATQRSPTFLQADQVPFRFVGIEAGMITQSLPNDFNQLFLNRYQVDDILESLGYSTIGTEDQDIPVLSSDVEDASAFSGRISFFVGRRFVSENAFWSTRAYMATEVLNVVAERAMITADLKMWEYAGSLRYNLGAGTFQPYAKVGYGVTWFRLENTAVSGDPVSQPTTPTVNPFTWHWGGGLEFLPIASFAPPPRGLDFGIRLEYAQFSHSLSIDKLVDPVTAALGSATGNPGVIRRAVTIALTLGF